MFEAIKGAEGLDKWLRLAMEGQAEFEEAWEARGRTRENVVTFYDKHIYIAERLLTNAWKLDKTRPETAATLILRNMSRNHRQKMRVWFDNAVKSQMDYAPAYDNYFLACDHYWSGSAKEQRDFGLECLKTGRFDTDVPLMYLVVLRWAIEFEYKPLHGNEHYRTRMPDTREHYRTTEAHGNVSRLFENLLADPGREDERDRIMVLYAMTEAWSGRYEHAKELLGKAEGETDLSDGLYERGFVWRRRHMRPYDEPIYPFFDAECLWWTPERRAIVDAEISAFTGALKETMERIQAAAGRPKVARSRGLLSRIPGLAPETGGPREVWRLYEEAWKNCEDKALRRYLADRIVYAKLAPGRRWYHVDIPALHCVAQAGNIEQARFLIENGVPVDSTDVSRGTPLMYAAKRGRTDMVGFLLDNGAEIGRENNTANRWALRGALLQRQEETAMLLLDKGAAVNVRSSRGYWPINTATEFCSAGVIARILEKGADPNASNFDGKTSLSTAARLGKTEAVRALLDGGATIDLPDAKGWTALHHAAFQGKHQVVRLLLERGADVNAKNNEGRTALRYALSYGYAEILKMLMLRFAEVDPKSKDEYGWTLLHHAASGGNADMTKSLLDLGAAPNAGDIEAWTPLHLAAKNSRADVVRILLDRDADTEAATKYGYTPLLLAAKHAEPEVVELLLENGADVHARASKNRSVLHFAGQRTKGKAET